MVFWKKKALIMVMTVTFLASVFVSPSVAGNPVDDLSAEGIAVDFVVLRPLGLAVTAGGCAFFIASLPFTIWTEKRIKKAAHHLVGVPGAYTFTRPLGELKNHPESY